MVITQRDVKEAFDYDPDNGVCTWKIDKRKSKAGEPIDNRYRCRDGHIAITIKDRTHTLRRLIWLWMTGELPQRKVRHINGDKADHRWENLEEVKKKERFPIGTIKIAEGQWETKIMLGKDLMTVGVFESLKEGRAAYKQVKRLFLGYP